MLDPNFVIIGAIISFLGTIKYLIGTIKGVTKPNRVTWFLWALAPLIAFSAELDKGVGIQSLMTFMVGFNPLLIFLASFINKNAEWSLGKLDYTMGGLSLVGILLWIISGDGNYAIFFTIIADSLAAIPTVIKSYSFPETENHWVYSTAAISAFITILTIDTWDFAHFGFPLYILTLTILLVLLIKFKAGKYINKLLSSKNLDKI